MARLKRDVEAVERAEERQRKTEDCYNTILKELEELKDKLEQLPGSLLAQLADRDYQRVYEAAERIVSPEFGIPASALAGMGFCVERQNFVQRLREKTVADGEPVSIRKTELVTRDIGTAKVKGLPINTSLQFEFSTRKAGYLTLLNIGTSGAVCVHVPNAYVSVERTKIERDRTYTVPGSELLPWERLSKMGLDYLEVGPPGWEHVAVLVSEKPLISTSVLTRVSPNSPFARLGGDEFTELCVILNEEPSEKWTAGVLSFLVE
jgi:hypothetical protein